MVVGASLIMSKEALHFGGVYFLLLMLLFPNIKVQSWCRKKSEILVYICTSDRPLCQALLSLRLASYFSKISP